MRRDEVEALVSSAPPGRPLPMIYLVDNAEDPGVRITAFLLRVRAGGMMLALPGIDPVPTVLANLSESDPEAPLLYTPTQVSCETPRRRSVWASSLCTTWMCPGPGCETSGRELRCGAPRPSSSL